MVAQISERRVHCEKIHLVIAATSLQMHRSVSRTLNALRLKSISKLPNFTVKFAFQSTEQRNIPSFARAYR